MKDAPLLRATLIMGLSSPLLVSDQCICFTAASSWPSGLYSHHTLMPCQWEAALQQGARFITCLTFLAESVTGTGSLRNITFVCQAVGKSNHFHSTSLQLLSHISLGINKVGPSTLSEWINTLGASSFPQPQLFLSPFS